MRIGIPVALLVSLVQAPLLRAQLIQRALQEFPANTRSLEYDNLKALRRLPSYPELRKQYSSESLNRVKQTLLALGIPEEQLSEVVTASGPAGFFGLAQGDFEPKSIEKHASAASFARRTLREERVFCSNANVCLLLAADNYGQVIFGSFQQLREISDVRHAQATALTSNSAYAALLRKVDMYAPVIGLAPGSEIGEMMKEVAPPALTSKIDVTQWFGTVDAFSYSVRIDTLAHVAVNVLCKSDTESKMLSGLLSAAASLQRVTGAGSTASLGVQNISASSSGRFVFLKLDASLTP